jgi:phosphatidylinositol-3-phosphatase
MENHSYSSVIGSSAAPYENALANSCGLATNYHGVTHPSLPNYMAATGGTTAGITNDCSPSSSCESTGPSIFGQVAASHRQWRSYEESMPSNCDKTTASPYAVKHNPAPYYTQIASQCAQWDVPFGTTSSGPFLSAVRSGSLPAFSFVTPNLCNDTHDCSVGTGDAWLRSVVGQITSSAMYKAGRTAIFITWDEGESGGNHVPTIVVSPTVKAGTQSATNYDHYSLLRTAEEMLGLSLLGNASSASSMRSAFGL